MPIHDWTRVSAGIFRHFHLQWIAEISRGLNGGLLPDGDYAMAEQLVGDMGPDVLTLEAPSRPGPPTTNPGGGGLGLSTRPPKVRFHERAGEFYTRKAKAVVVRHVSRHEVVAMIELISPGNKAGQSAIEAFVRKAKEAIAAGIHHLIVDLFPPGPRDPQGCIA